MIGTDRDALLCDLAETYNIYDLRALPVMTLAALSFGLRPDSRIKMKMAGLNYISQQILLVHIADTLTLMRFGLFAGKDDKQPELYSDIMNGNSEQDVAVFESGEAFEAERQRILRRLGYG